MGNITASEVNEIYHIGGWAVPNNSLVLNYDFTNAFVEDLSGFGFNPFNLNATAVPDRFGALDNAIGFNGIDEFCETSGVPIYDNISISAWFNTSTDFSNGYRSFADLSGFSALSIGANNFLEGTLRFGDADYALLSSNVAVNDGLWHHAVLTYDGTTARLYLDNVLVDSRTDYSGPLFKNSLTTFLNLGFIYDAVDPLLFTGQVDDINYYNYGISSSEVNSLFSENNWSSTTTVASYFFNGDASDNSGNNLNGSVVGATLIQDRFGATDSAYNFNGNAYIAVQDDPLFSIGTTTDLSISGWFNTTSSSGVLFDKSDGNTGYIAYIPDDGFNQILFLAVQGGVGSSQVRSSAGYNDGNWHHFVMQMDRDGGMQIYIDGLLDQEDANALSDGFNPDIGEDFLIGVTGGVDNAGLNTYFNGSLDDFQIFKKLLTPGEITGLYEDGTWPILGQVQIKISQSAEDRNLEPYYTSLGREFGNAFEFSSDVVEYILNGRSDRPYGDSNNDNFIDILGTPIVPQNGLNFVKLFDATRGYEVARINSIVFLGSARTGDETGWQGEDWDMNYVGGGVFELNNISLFHGAWKIRADDSWDYANWGSRPGEEGQLSLFTENIPIERGTYNISVDVVNRTYNVTAVEPIAQPTDFVVNNLGATFAEFSFTASENVSGFLVLRSEVQTPTSVPEDFITYQNGEQINGETVVYSGSSRTIIDENLVPETQYFYAVYAYNGTGNLINYLTINPLTGDFTTEPQNLATAPSAQPTAFEVVSKSDNSAELRFSKSDASGYLVVRSENSSSLFIPTDGIAYNVGDSFDGAVITYVGENDIWNESDLTPLTQYYYKVYAFNGTGNDINYLEDNPLLGDLLTLTTAPLSQAENFAVVNQTFTSFKVTFTPDFADADGYIVIRKEGSTPPNVVPAGGTSYGLGEIAVGEEVVAFGAVSEVEETNLNMGDTFSYAIYSFNGENDYINYNLTSPLTGTASTLVDNTGPILQSIQFDGEISLGDPVNITVNVIDEESGVEQVQIRYITPGFNNFDNPTIDNMILSGGVYTYEISNITEAGVEFKIFSRNNIGLEELSNTQSVRTVYSGDGLQIPFSSFGSDETDYRITSVPLNLESSTVDDVYGKELGPYGDKSKWRMFRYSNEVTSELSGSTSLIPGRGYWLIVNDNEVSFFSGSGKNVAANTDEPYEIVLTPGWNQIGNPYPYDISWSDVQEFNNQDFQLRIFNGSFVNGSTLSAFSGGFVNWPNSTDFTLRIPKTKLSSAQSRKSTDEAQGWDIDLILENGLVINTLTGIGMHENADNKLDSKDQFNLPRFLSYIDLNHPIKANGFHVAKNIVKIQDQYTWTFDIESNLNLRNTTIKWEIPGNSSFNSENELFLWDPSSSNLIDMRKSNQYQLRNSSGKGIRIIYGSLEYVNSLLKTTSFQVNDPFPNPTSGMLNINYFIPKGQDKLPMTIEVYNLNGNLVDKKLIEHTHSGIHSVSWDLNDGAEEKLKGIYLLRVTNGLNSINKKIILR